MKHKRWVVVALLGVAGLASSASAGLIDINITGALAAGNESLYLPDHQWLEGRDWGWTPDTNPANGTGTVSESWIAGAPVTLNVEALTDGIDPDVTITKSLTNNTGFAWTSFQIDLLQFSGFGPLSVYPGSVGSSRFSVHNTTNFGSGNAQMIFSLGGGDSAVLPGQNVSFFFTFNIPGDVAFKMVQTPIPVPGSLALVGMAGLAAIRRRR